ncbi:MAG TPA: ribonuclease J [Reyranella sp.]
MNLNLYGHAGKWLMVDLGIGFADDSMPGVDVVMPDPAFIEERRRDLVGIVLTHAHEDHLGAVADLWPRLKAPVYATPFAGSVLRRKLMEAGLVDAVPVTEIPLGGKFSLPPFELELITMTHSILEPNALAIRTKLGTVFHTGDWKIDPEPLLGEVTDEAMLRRIGDEGALAMVCDSTNVFVEGEAGSEATVRANLEKLVKVGKGRVAVTCFASNLARVESVALAAAAPFHRSLRRSRKDAPSTGTTPSPSRASRPAGTWSMTSAGPGASRTRVPLGATIVSGTWQARARAACSIMWRTSPWTGRAILGRIH